MIIVDAITFVEVYVVKNIFRLFGAVGSTAKFLTKLTAAPFSMYRF